LLVLLAAFAVLPLALPWLVRRIGPRAFSSRRPLAGFVQAAAMMTPRVSRAR
jgi:multicomponent Na+:H+ antiporter subunit A